MNFAMEQERIEQLLAWAKQQKKEKDYAKVIASDIEAVTKRRENLCAMDEEDYKSWLAEYAAITRKETGICMKIKHFFKIVYPEGSSFDRTLKGKDYLEHLFKFRDFVEGPIYNIKLYY